MTSQIKETTEDELKYKAPALEKGLDILELLARNSVPLTSSQIATTLGRSVSELFRMILALEYRGYIMQVADGYALTNKLFTLGIAQGTAKTLLDASLPVMKELSAELGQSCHLVVPSGDQIVVIARQESPMDLGFSVRVGYRRRLIDTNSGALLFGFSSTEEQSRWLSQLTHSATPDEMQRFHVRVKPGVEKGYIQQPSDFVDGVMDFCMPICNRQGAVAVLIVPFIRIKAQAIPEEKVINSLGQAANKIAHDLID
jgi:DNA-binding IclR family transcriptional regulator